jgi:hypothetical protein
MRLRSTNRGCTESTETNHMLSVFELLRGHTVYFGTYTYPQAGGALWIMFVRESVHAHDPEWKSLREHSGQSDLGGCTWSLVRSQTHAVHFWGIRHWIHTTSQEYSVLKKLSCLMGEMCLRVWMFCSDAPGRRWVKRMHVSYGAMHKTPIRRCDSHRYLLQGWKVYWKCVNPVVMK